MFGKSKQEKIAENFISRVDLERICRLEVKVTGLSKDLASILEHVSSADRSIQELQGSIDTLGAAHSHQGYSHIAYIKELENKFQLLLLQLGYELYMTEEIPSVPAVPSHLAIKKIAKK